MIKVTAFKEFSREDIANQTLIPKENDDVEKRKKAHKYKMEMLAYNARALRGDFDRY